MNLKEIENKVTFTDEGGVVWEVFHMELKRRVPQSNDVMMKRWHHGEYWDQNSVVHLFKTREIANTFSEIKRTILRVTK